MVVYGLDPCLRACCRGPVRGITVAAPYYVTTAVYEKLLQRVRYTAKGCWLWQGPLAGGRKGSGRYGVICVPRPKHMEYAHRLSWMYTHQRHIPKGRYVLHRPPCNSKRCVNPEHLYLGTQRDNMRDFRVLGGTSVTRAKLTVTEVRRIKRLLGLGRHTHEEIGKLVGAKRETVSQINRGAQWKDV